MIQSAGAMAGLKFPEYGRGRPYDNRAGARRYSSLRWAKIFVILKEAQFRVRPGCSETTLQSEASAISSVEIAALNVSYIRDGIHSRRR
jgi:hypothetical protein